MYLKSSIILFALIAMLLIACQYQPIALSERSIEQDFERVGVDSKGYELFIRAFKLEKEVEIWVKDKQKTKFELLRTYAICKSSGKLGPKRKEGDKQVPEGVYFIDRFNPNSLFHLSLGLNYPNISDKIRGDQQQPGSDIFIHGACVSVGCLPLTDMLIEEVYALAEYAKEQGQQNIPVHIFPARMETKTFEQVAKKSSHQAFWRELRPIYDFFEQKNKLPSIIIAQNGAYQVK